MDEIFSIIRETGGARVVTIADPASGLRAFIAIDDTTLGPAAGGVRTMRYASAKDGLIDALRLARAMTVKCSLAGLDAGGAKAVVLVHDQMNRQAAFKRLGQAVTELQGLFRTAGDLGTTAADLQTMAEVSPYVHTDEKNLAAAVARGIVRCIEACAHRRGVAMQGLTVAVQGAGSIGASAARAMAAAGMNVIVADVDDARARKVAEEIPGARVVSPDHILLENVDVVAPCATGGVITDHVARELRAWAVCGGANNALASRDVAYTLMGRDILHVPDPIASAGAVIDGIGKSVMMLDDPTALIDRLGTTAREVLEEAATTRTPPIEIADRRAMRRIHDARNVAKA